TVALHYVYNTPHDRLVWDVGHQCYAHKILTGRKDKMSRLRMWEGLAGFPTRLEGEYDHFGVAHSSTSISAAHAMAEAARLQGIDRQVVAIIGDGAMSAGMAFEAMNNAGNRDTNMLVILNDNDMSISEPVGALNTYLARLLASRSYQYVRRVGESVLSRMNLDRFGARWEEHLKGMVMPGTLFEEFGFNYIGPIDGHDVTQLVETLHRVKALKGPQLLHVMSKKGKGYAKAEADPILYHGVGVFDPAQGIVAKSNAVASKPTYSEIFGQWLCDQAEADPRLVAITPAMREGSGMVAFSKRFPERYWDVGIAEQHSVTFAAGLATEGLKPVVAIYSTFLQRAYDQLIHDVALQNLPVVFAIDRAGQVGADGATHAGSFDISYLRCIPNMVVMTPSDESECRQALSTAYALDVPTAVRYPRGAGTGVAATQALNTLPTLPLGKAVRKRQGSKVAILAFGPLLHTVSALAETLDASLVDMRFVKPLDTALLTELASEHTHFITLEENVVAGGAGSAVLEFFAHSGIQVNTLILGFPDAYIEQGDSKLQMQAASLSAAQIDARVHAWLAQHV
ncbi:MAG: hypothetical protein RLZZ502_641, partial [Pseudomonadota bacterium]